VTRKRLAGAGAGAIAAGAVAALGIASCSGHPSGTPSPTPLVTQPPTQEALDAVLKAVTTVSGTTATYTMTMSHAQALGDQASGSGGFDFKRAQGTMALTLGNSLGDEQLIFTDGGMYLHQAITQPGGKGWLGYSSGDAASTRIPVLAIQIMALNPGFLVSELQWGAVSAAPAGSGDVAGTPVSNYVVTVDLARARSTVSGPGAVLYGLGLQSEVAHLGAGSSATPSISMQVAVDRSGRLRRVEVNQDFGQAGDDVLTFSAFGAAVTVTLPPSDQVDDLASLVPGGEPTETAKGKDGDAS
jgi:hypothetical protein